MKIDEDDLKRSLYRENGIKHKNYGMIWDGIESEVWKKCFRDLNGNDGDMLKNGIGLSTLNLNVCTKWK